MYLIMIMNFHGGMAIELLSCNRDFYSDTSMEGH